MILHHEFNKNQNFSDTQTIVFIHGLFGSLSNLGMLARAFTQMHHVVQIDVRNHGKSVHSSEINYRLMALDVLETLDYLNIQNFIVVGHSMGGKISMKLAEIAQNRLEKLIVLDMAPYAAIQRNHDKVFEALFAVENAQIESRQEALTIMRNHLKEEMVIQFLMKSFSKGHWLFNVKALYDNYSNILAWDTVRSEVPAIFIRGGVSPYLAQEAQRQAVYSQFPNATIATVDGAGHWLHAEKTNEVLEHIQSFI